MRGLGGYVFQAFRGVQITTLRGNYLIRYSNSKYECRSALCGYGIETQYRKLFQMYVIRRGGTVPRRSHSKSWLDGEQVIIRGETDQRGHAPTGRHHFRHFVLARSKAAPLHQPRAHRSTSQHSVAGQQPTLLTHARRSCTRCRKNETIYSCCTSVARRDRDATSIRPEPRSKLAAFSTRTQAQAHFIWRSCSWMRMSFVVRGEVVA
jgi:hypothetical protein